MPPTSTRVPEIPGGSSERSRPPTRRLCSNSATLSVPVPRVEPVLRSVVSNRMPA